MSIRQSLLFTALLALSLCLTAAQITATDLNAAPAPATECAAYWGGQMTLQLTEGPYYLDELLFRQNITENQAGVPLELRITVLDTSCSPLEDVFVDIWHCNATGFDGASSMGGGSAMGPASGGGASGGPGGSGSKGPLGGPDIGLPPMPSGGPTQGGAGSGGMQGQQANEYTFLRGTVMSDSAGLAVINTIVPGWYSGRAVHVHTKMHVPYNVSSNETLEYEDSHEIHTGQFFFTEAILEDIALLKPYVQHNGTARTLNSQDDIYGGDVRQLLSLSMVQQGNLSAGLIAEIIAVVDPGAAYVYTSGSVTSDVAESTPGTPAAGAGPALALTAAAPAAAASSAGRRMMS